MLHGFALSVTLPLNGPLTLTLSPSDGEREEHRAPAVASPSGDNLPTCESFSLSPAEGERAGMRGFSDGIDAAKPAKARTPNGGEFQNGTIGRPEALRVDQLPFAQSWSSALLWLRLRRSAA